MSVQPLPGRLPRTQRHLGAVMVEQGAGGPVCVGSTVALRGRGGRYIDVEDGVVSARWSSPVDERQALRLELHGSEVLYGRASPPVDAAARVVCHGDILCVRTHTGRLLRLVAATEGDLPELSATAESHEDAQRWEVLMA